MAGMWNSGDIVARGVIILLLIMSLMSWYIILTKLWDQRRLKQSARAAEKQFWSAPSLKDGVERLKKGDSFRAVAEDGLRSVSHHEGRLTDRIDMHEWVTMSLQRSVDQVNSNMSKGLGFLATVGSSAPFVGLFGTVWGVMTTLITIGLSGQPSIDKVAGPIGGALIMTALGLFVAVPAVWGYNWLLGRNKVLQDALRNFAGDLHAYLVSGARMSAGPEVGGAARATPAPAAAVRK
ncbi:MAG: MotA/TolQ/ExbB proton channel family protein [Gammaproteobacteria bacterium]|nr:MotA/TolQ/ExbB proton channel family protein [Gammaproteobacteria bacterium]